MKKTLCTLAVLTALSAYAADGHKHDHDHDHDGHTEHLGAHVHGEAYLNVVLEGEALSVELDSPAMNFMGFEHKPSSEADLEQSHEALHTLQDAEWLAIHGGECHLHEADVDWQYAEMVHDHFHGDDQHDDHQHDAHKEADHKHDDHAHQHEEHDHAHGHDHEDGDHSDIEGEFEFDCHHPEAVKSIDVKLFDAFPGLEKLTVQWIVGGKQGSQTLTKASHQLNLD